MLSLLENIHNLLFSSTFANSSLFEILSIQLFFFPFFATFTFQTTPNIEHLTPLSVIFVQIAEIYLYLKGFKSY